MARRAGSCPGVPWVGQEGGAAFLCLGWEFWGLGWSPSLGLRAAPCRHLALQVNTPVREMVPGGESEVPGGGEGQGERVGKVEGSTRSRRAKEYSFIYNYC